MEREKVAEIPPWMTVQLHPHHPAASLVLSVERVHLRGKSLCAPDWSGWTHRASPIFAVLLKTFTLHFFSPFSPKKNKVNTQLWCVSPAPAPGLLPPPHPHIASLFIPSHQTLSKLISKSWEHLIVLINPMPGEIWFRASESSRLLWIDSLFWVTPAFPI